MKCLRQDAHEYIKQDISGAAIFKPLYKHEYTTDSDYSSLWTHFINLLAYLPKPDGYFQRFINTLKDYFTSQDRLADLAVLDNFQRDYVPEKAIWWYTTSTFLHILLNRALRQHNIRVSFLFGFFLCDIQAQLRKEYDELKNHSMDNPIILTYRGQMMSHLEIQELHRAIITTNSSLLSTTVERSTASFFHNSTSDSNVDGLQSILYEIEIDVRNTSRPYGYIAHLSHIPNEYEILFMIGTQFQKKIVFFDEPTKTLIVQLNLVDDYAMKDDKDFVSTSKRKTLKNCISTLPSDFHYGSFEEIDLIFTELIDLYPVEKWIEAVKMHWLGCYEVQKQRNYMSAIKIYTQALNMWNEYYNDHELNCSIDISHIHQSLAFCYQKMDKVNKDNIERLDMVKKHYDLSIKYKQKAIANSQTEYEKMNLNLQLAAIYEEKMNQMSKNINEFTENLLMCIKYKELAIESPSMNSFKPNAIADHLQQQARFYQLATKYDDSLYKYQEAINIYVQQLKPNYTEVRKIYVEMVKIYVEQKQDFHSALDKQKLIHESILQNNVVKPKDEYDDDDDDDYQNRLNWKNENVANSYVALADIYKLLNDYSSALDNLTTASDLYGDSTIFNRELKIAHIKEKLADIHLLRNDYDLAYNNVLTVLKIYEKLNFKADTAVTLKEKLADIYIAKGDYEQANEMLNTVLLVYQKTNQAREMFMPMYTEGNFQLSQQLSELYKEDEIKIKRIEEKICNIELLLKQQQTQSILNNGK